MNLVWFWWCVCVFCVLKPIKIEFLAYKYFGRKNKWNFNYRCDHEQLLSVQVKIDSQKNKIKISAQFANVETLINQQEGKEIDWYRVRWTQQIIMTHHYQSTRILSNDDSSSGYVHWQCLRMCVCVYDAFRFDFKNYMEYTINPFFMITQPFQYHMLIISPNSIAFVCSY